MKLLMIECMYEPAFQLIITKWTGIVNVCPCIRLRLPMSLTPSEAMKFLHCN